MTDTREITPAPPVFTPEQVALLKRTVARGATDDELRLFAHVCQRTGLDPFLRQIHCVKRWDSELQREVMTVQTGIDGLRLIAERTGRYAPGREPAFTYADDGSLVGATAFVKKQTADGTWHEFAATALFAEYGQKRKDGQLKSFWVRMPHGQLAKCAEALALRRGFPQETSGLYTPEEMAQADDVVSPDTPPFPKAVEHEAAARAVAATTATVEFRGDRYPTAGIGQDTFDLVQALCKRVGRDCASSILRTFEVGGVFELTEATGRQYVAALEQASEGVEPEVPLGEPA